MNPPDAWMFVPLLALATPAVLALAGVLAPERARAAALTAAALAALFVLAVGARPSGAAVAPWGVPADLATCVMLSLVCGLGLVVVAYARTYLQGEPGRSRALRWLSLTLAAVTSLVVAGDLLTVALAWTATSLSLHRLLTFYPDRTAALVAAHKKFLVSRMADVCMVGALALVHGTVGSFGFDDIARWTHAQVEPAPAMELAAVLLVIAVALRSAQLPFHGWITQVMEAPTPVSALLHAGVVNIGGFVLIRLAPWIGSSVIASVLLVVLGLGSAVVASSAMATRVSVKVALAWSTCAQMGFMLVQCGLGLWSLALLHLVAHSLYKAHAFLRAGSAVEAWELRSFAPSVPPTSAASLQSLGWALGSGVVAFAVLQAIAAPGAPTLPTLALAAFVALSVMPLARRSIATAPARPRARLVGVPEVADDTPSPLAATARTAARIALVLASCCGWHAVAAMAWPEPAQAIHGVAWALAAGGVALLALGHAVLRLRPRGRLACALHPWLLGGLFLDERFTRLTFWLWPPRLPQPPRRERALRRTGSFEAQT